VRFTLYQRGAAVLRMRLGGTEGNWGSSRLVSWMPLNSPFTFCRAFGHRRCRVSRRLMRCEGFREAPSLHRPRSKDPHH
jgi:hypothetical protein